MFYVSEKQMRDIEEAAINDLQIPSLILMENAACATFSEVEKFNPDKIAVVCGCGNNGGDGFAAARLLYVKGMQVSVSVIGDSSRIKGDALTNFNIIKNLGLLSDSPLETLLDEADIIVDALIGIGLHGELQKEASQAIDAINRAAKKVLSVDIPSGVEADTGKVSGAAVKADITVTFGCAKIGHVLYPGTEYCGKVRVKDISVPGNYLSNRTFLESLDKAVLPPRPLRSNKGTYGRVCVLAGSKDMPGAAVLCCKAAYKSGAGLVHACVVEEVAAAIKQSAHEVITTTIKGKNGAYSNFSEVKEAVLKADVIVIGPGIGQGSKKFVNTVLQEVKKPLVIDADALTLLDKSLLNKFCVITPHPGEMAKLTGFSVKEVLEDIIKCARDFAGEYGAVTLLKDARTIIASPCGKTYINTSGSPALAKAGSGDVLAGVLAAFLAQGMNTLDAAVLAANIHGKAGQAAARDLSVYGVRATDVIEYISKVMK